MRKLTSWILALALLLALLATPIMASDISGARYWATVVISNNSTATTNVATTANISTTNLIAGNYLNSSANNCVMRNSSGADVPFMPGYTDDNLWAMWVPSIGADSLRSYILYTANSTGGLFRYFPGDGGMTTPDDDADLEIGDNFTIEQKGWVDTAYSVNKSLVYKPGAFRTYISGTGNITSSIEEDFTTYTEVDTTKLTVTVTKATAVDVDRDEDVYLYYDKGVNHFDSLDVDFEIFISSASLDGAVGGMAITNTVNDLSGFAATDISAIANRTGAAYFLILKRGPAVAQDIFPGAADTLYYCTLERAAGNDTVTLKIYTDAGRATLVDTLTVAGFGATKYRYVYGFVNYNLGAGGQDFDGYVQNLDLKVRVTATGISSANITVATSANITHMWIDIDEVTKDTIALGGASVVDNSENWSFLLNDSMLYMEYQEITIDGVQVQYIEWEYDDVFDDQSAYDNDATPSFRAASSDLDVSANMTAFTPVAEAKAPDYVLGVAPPFIDADALTGNVTAPFTTVPPAGTFPLAGVITAVANATDTPPQLPLLIIAVFCILAASLTISATIRLYGSGSLIVKIITITAVMGIFIGIGNFGIDFWMLVVFLIIATALAMGSKQIGWQ